MSLRRVRWSVVLAALVGAGLSCSDATGPLDRPGPPAEVTVAKGDDQTGTAGSVATDSLVLVVKDEDSRPVRGVIVTFAVGQGGGTLSAAKDTTDANGRVAVRWTLGPEAGEQRVLATVEGLATSIVFDAEVEPAAPAAITAVGGAAQEGTVGALAPDTLVAKVTDQFGNPVGGVVVTWAASTGAALAPVTSTTDAAGLVKARLTAGTAAGIHTATASVAGITTPATFTFVAAAGAPASVAVTGGGQSAAMGAALADSVVARVSDQHGNPVAGVAVDFSTAHGGSFSPASGTTDASGRIATRWTLGGILGMQAARVAVAGLDTATVTATATLPAGSVLARTSGDGGEQQVYSLRTITVRAQGAAGQPIPGLTVTWTVTGPEWPNGGWPHASLSAATAVTDANGQASTTLRLSSRVGTNTVTASADGLAPASFSVAGTAQPWCNAGLSGNSATTGVVGEPLGEPLTLTSTDRFGNPSPGGFVSFGNGPGTITTDAQGRYIWTLGTTAGQQSRFITYQVCQSTSLEGPATPRGQTVEVRVTALPGPAAQVSAATGNGATSQVGSSIPVTAIVGDQYGNAVAGATVNWTVGSGGGVVAPASSVSGSGGVAAATWTFGGTAGAQSLVATLATTGDTALFSATAVAGPASGFVKLSGDAQAGMVNAMLADSLVVRVTDAGGSAVQGASVTFTPAAGSGTVSATTVLTDALGRAGVRWTLGTIVGTHSVVVSSGALAPLTFTATARAGLATLIEKISGDAQTGPAGLPLPESLVVRLRDQFGNVVPGSMVVWTPDEHGGTVRGASSLTDANGLSRVEWTITEGEHAVSATAGSAGNVVFTGTGTSGTAALSRTGTATSSALAYALQPLTVLARDASGQPAAGVTVTWSVTGPAPRGSLPGASLDRATSVTNSEGVASAALRLSTTVGANQVTASAAGYTPATFAIEGRAHPFCSAGLGGIAATPSTPTLLAGSQYPSPLTAFSADQFGNPAGGYSPGPTLPDGGSISGALTTDATGQSPSSATWTLGSTVGTQRLRYTGYTCTGTSPEAPYLAQQLTLEFAVNAVSPDPVRLIGVPTSDRTVSAGDTAILVAKVENGAGTGMPGVVVTFAVTSGSGALSATTDTSDASGLVSTVLTSSATPGAAQVTASASGLQGWTFRITGVQPGTARLQLGVGDGQVAAPGSWLNAFNSVKVVDASGNAIPNARVAWAVSSGGGEVDIVDSVSRSNGFAVANWRLGASGAAQTLTASLPDNPAAAPLTFSASALLFSDATVRCALTTAGEPYCRDGNGWPAPLATNLRFSKITSSDTHQCALTAEGAAWCWGANQAGQLGTGDTLSSAVPRAVGGAHTFTSIDAGSGHTCAIRTDGTAWCWGENSWGQLGNGATSASCNSFGLRCERSPVQVTGSGTWSMISAGRDALTCAIDTNGRAWCWGRDLDGELGRGTVGGNSSSPVPIASELTFTFISAESGACAIAQGGTAYCWGDNTFGELGIGSADQADHPTPTAVPGMSFREIWREGGQTCALDTGGLAWCWGLNSEGQLGATTGECRAGIRCSASPVAVSGGIVFARMQGANSATCATTADGRSYCWPVGTGSPGPKQFGFRSTPAFP